MEFVGTGQQDKMTTLNIYPSPATDAVTIVDPDAGSGGLLSVSDVNGKDIIKQNISAVTTVIMVSGLKPGLYLVKVINANRVIKGMFIKQ